MFQAARNFRQTTFHKISCIDKRMTITTLHNSLNSSILLIDSVMCLSTLPHKNRLTKIDDPGVILLEKEFIPNEIKVNDSLANDVAEIPRLQVSRSVWSTLFSQTCHSDGLFSAVSDHLNPPPEKNHIINNLYATTICLTRPATANFASKRTWKHVHSDQVV